MSSVADRQARSAPRNVPDDPITRWLLMVAALIVAMVVVGGYVRLSRAGLSIVEWDIVTGVVPPIGDAAWEQSFIEYQQTPEYQLVNKGMSLADYQRIFYIEWAHRLIARIAGLLVVLPLVWFLWKRRMTIRESLPYWGIAVLFGLQGAMGWVMVASGLRDRPVVSHFRLTIHLMAALALLGLVLWMAFNRMEKQRPAASRSRPDGRRSGRYLAWALLVSVVVQIAYGGLVAGLKAGYISNTWPLMFGRIIPSNLLTVHDPWWINLFESLGSHWIHRWLAFVVAGIAVAAFVVVRRDQTARPALRATTSWTLVIVLAQIALGVTVVLLGVPKWFALAHQAIGVVLFCASLVIAHQVSADSPDANASLAQSV
ncbi:MAG: COX15/CtaA family protein [Acidimicrobiia bacterium]|nr:COX15/CtaA family protein [Acidimicrobiia bacterium]